MPRNRWRQDQGSTTVALLAIMQMILMAGVLAWACTVLVVDRQQVTNAADLAALAGAQAMREPVPEQVRDAAAWRAGQACDRAALIASANEAELSTCTIDGADVVVTAERAPAPFVVRWFSWLDHSLPRVRQIARAGP